jgi:hypothetical protein
MLPDCVRQSSSVALGARRTADRHLSDIGRRRPNAIAGMIEPVLQDRVPDCRPAPSAVLPALAPWVWMGDIELRSGSQGATGNVVHWVRLRRRLGAAGVHRSRLPPVPLPCLAQAVQRAQRFNIKAADLQHNAASQHDLCFGTDRCLFALRAIGSHPRETVDNRFYRLLNTCHRFAPPRQREGWRKTSMTRQSSSRATAG